VAHRPTSVESGEEALGGKPVIIGVAIIAVLAVMAVAGMMLLGEFELSNNRSSKVKFAVDGGVVKYGDGWGGKINYFAGAPQIRIGDPPPAGFPQGTYEGTNARTGTPRVRVDGQWDSGCLLALRVTYWFEDNKLSSVSLSFCPESFEAIVKKCSEKFGPAHHVSKPTFTTLDGAIHQNQVVSWETDTGLFYLKQFDTADGGTWWRDHGKGGLQLHPDDSAEK
jgi:hypothetical protein